MYRFTNKIYIIEMGPCRCELLLRWGLPCKHYLQQIYHNGQPIPRSLVHPRYWLQGPAIHSTNWQPQYPGEERIAYEDPLRADAESVGQEIIHIRRQMGPEEGVRYDAQLLGEHRKMVEIGKQALALQAIPIGNPDPVPKRQYQKKKTHGKADARGLSGAEIAKKDLKARETREIIASRERNAVTPEVEDKDEGILVMDTPPPSMPAGESQGGTSITLALRPSPEQPRRVPPPPIRTPFYRLFPEDPQAPSASTAPPELGRGKRKREHTERYELGVEDGLIDQSQHGALGRP